MAITVPTFDEAKTILEAMFPLITLDNGMIELSRYRIAVGLDPLPGQNITIEKLIKKVINHENRLDALEGP